MFQAQNRENVNSTWNVAVSFKIIMQSCSKYYLIKYKYKYKRCKYKYQYQYMKSKYKYKYRKSKYQYKYKVQSLKTS